MTWSLLWHRCFLLCETRKHLYRISSSLCMEFLDASRYFIYYTTVDPMLTTVQVLRGETAITGKFDKDGFNEDQHDEVLQKIHGGYFSAFVYLCTMIVHFIFGDMEKALHCANRAPIHVVEHLRSYCDFRLWSSLVYASMQTIFVSPPF